MISPAARSAFFVSLLLTSLSPTAAQSSACAAFERQLILSSDLEQADHLGAAVSMDGDVLVLGAPLEHGAGLDLGAAYVYRHDGVAWVEEQKLTPSSASTCNRFGYAVAVDGAVVVVGADRDDIPQGTSEAGSAFVYRFDGAQWNEEQKLVSSNIAVDDRFGFSVAVSGDLIAVGAPRHAHGLGTVPGSAYSFRWTTGAWVEEQELFASDGHVSDAFGHSVALDGDLLAVGANKSYLPGAAYLYSRVGGSWGAEQKVSASDGEGVNEFGISVALGRNTLVVGAAKDDALGPWAGAAYLFHRVGSTWVQERKFLASDGENGDIFGESLALDGTQLVVGSKWLDHVGSSSGGAYAFDLTSLPACPSIYCTAKLNSAGCLPFIGFTGSPSASSPGPFYITAGDVVNRQPGLLVYGFVQTSVPYIGGTLCVARPFQQRPLPMSGGSPGTQNDCTGSFIFPMNYWIQSGNDADLLPGVTVHAQIWYRDRYDPFQKGLTDALTFVINP